MRDLEGLVVLLFAEVTKDNEVLQNPYLVLPLILVLIAGVLNTGTMYMYSSIDYYLLAFI